MSGVLARLLRSGHEFAYFGILGAVAVFAGVVVLALSAVDQPADGGRALGRRRHRRGQVVTSPKPKSPSTQGSMGHRIGEHARLTGQRGRVDVGG